MTYPLYPESTMCKITVLGESVPKWTWGDKEAWFELFSGFASLFIGQVVIEPNTSGIDQPNYDWYKDHIELAAKLADLSIMEIHLRGWEQKQLRKKSYNKSSKKRTQKTKRG